MKQLWRKGALVCLCLVLLVLPLTETFCWQSVSQAATNEAWGEPAVPVDLDIFERDHQGDETEIPIPGTDFHLYDSEGTQVGGIFTADEDGKINVTLPPGDYYFEEWDPAPWHSFDLDESGVPIKKYPFTVSEEDVNSEDPVKVTAYNPRLIGSLAVTKTVENPGGSPLIQLQKDQEFTFTVTFSNGGAYDYVILDADGKELSSGTLPSGGTLKLKHGQRAVFEKVPAGIQYTVVETPVDGYAIRSTGHTGTITEEGVTADFHNLYQKAILAVSKTIVNEDGTEPSQEQLAQEFPFTVTFSDGGTYSYTVLDDGENVVGSGTLSSGGKIALKHGQTALFPDIPDQVTYSVTETPVPEGYRPVYTTFGGALAGGFIAHADFENRFYEEPEPPGGLVVEKTIENPGGAEPTEAQKALEFEFTVVFADGGTYPYTVRDAQGKEQASGLFSSGGTAKLRHGWRLTFPELPKGLDYTVSETGTNDYRALLQWADATIQGGVTAELLCRNIPPEPETGTLTLTKRLEGVPPGGSDKEFVFTVTFSDKESHSYTIYNAADEVQGTGELASSGTLALRHAWRVVFPDLPKNVTYTITEQDYAAEGCALTITNGAGTIIGEEIAVEAVNTYPWIQIDGEKTWDLGGHTDVTLPASIWVKLCQGKTLIHRVRVSPDADGSWTYSFHVPKSDPDGNEIIYHVEEEPVARFTPAYDRESFDIVNHYTPPSDPKPPRPTPKVTPTPTPSGGPTLPPVGTPTPSGEPTPPSSGTPAPSGEPTPSETPTPSGEPTPTPSETPTPSGEPTPPPSDTPTPSGGPIPPPSVTPTPGGGSTPPSKETPPPGPDIPKTGDDRALGLWLVLALVALATFFASVWYSLKHRYRGRRLKR